MNEVRAIAWRMAALLVAVAMLMWACTTKPTGNEPVNHKPVVQIVNIPPSNSHFTQSPIINWYGTDSDGFIIMYEYAVVPFSDIPSSVDTTDINALRNFAATQIKYADQGPCDPACWTVVNVKTSESPTRQQVELVAAANPADTVKQYFFVRAVDDDSARSEIEVRVYSRNNNPPTTTIKTLPDSSGYYDLPDTNAVYHGIQLEWQGEDKIDFPAETDKPKFTYFYQVFGPFDQGELSFDDSWNFTDGFDFDTLAAASRLISQSSDSLTGSVWIKATSHTFWNLWRNQPASDTTRVGYFVLKVTARDDAAVSSVKPAYKVFQAIDPKFEDDILVYYPINGLTKARPGEIWGPTYRDDPTFPDSFYTEADMLQYYYDVFNEAGYQIPTIIRGKVDVNNPPAQNIPPKALLAKYKLYVIIDDGENGQISKSHFERISHYMDLGGNVWLWAVFPFSPYQTSGKGTAALSSMILQSKDPVDVIPYKYFDILAQWCGGWTQTYTSRVSWYPQSGAPEPQTNEDFIGAVALPGTGFPDLTVNLKKVQGTYIYNYFDTRDWARITFRGSPNANYFVRDIFSQPIYLYNSVFGDVVPDSMKEYVSPLQGTVTGLRYNSGVFKTAVFGFSMWTIHKDEAVAATRQMLQWFLQN